MIMVEDDVIIITSLLNRRGLSLSASCAKLRCVLGLVFLPLKPEIQIKLLGQLDKVLMSKRRSNSLALSF